jgi:hypothetical protein
MNLIQNKKAFEVGGAAAPQSLPSTPVAGAGAGAGGADAPAPILTAVTHMGGGASSPPPLPRTHTLPQASLTPPTRTPAFAAAAMWLMPAA